MRKSIHLSSIMIPILYSFLSKETMLWMLVPATALSFIIEIARFNNASFDRVFMKMFGSILRAHEKSGKFKLSGATYVLLSATLCVLIFPRVITIAGFSILIISDTSAALIGRRYGRRKFLEKSLEGSLAFLVSACICFIVVGVVFSAPLIYYIVAFISAVVATVAEAKSHGLNIDDNLTIPISFGIVMWSVLAIIGGSEVSALLAR